MNPPIGVSSLRIPLVLAAPALRAAEKTEPLCPVSPPVRDLSVWSPPPIRPEGFQFEIQISSLGSSYDLERLRHSIRSHNLGEYDSAVSKVMAAEWGYSFTPLDGQVDGAGRRIQAGYPLPPARPEPHAW